jgi:hypothetical protein
MKTARNAFFIAGQNSPAVFNNELEKK